MKPGDTAASTRSGKKPEDIVRRLVEIVSKGGNYLLNIGPRGDGSIPEASVATLEQVGAWMRKNGASIHGASASPFSEFPWGRCTVKDNVLYLHVFKRPADGALELPGLRSKVRKAYLLADSGKSLESTRNGSSVRISLPPTPTDAIDTVVALELDGPPRVDPPVIVEKAGAPVVLDGLNAVSSRRTVKRFNRRGQFHISKWTGPADQASWRVRFLQPGRYRVLVECAAAFGRPTGTFVLSSGDQKVQMESPLGSDWYQYASRDIGVLDVAAAGEQELVLRPAREIGQDVMYFKSLKLERLHDPPRIWKDDLTVIVMKNRLMNASVRLVTVAVAFAAVAAAETLVFDQSQCTGVSGFRAHWNQPIPIAPSIPPGSTGSTVSRRAGGTST